MTPGNRVERTRDSLFRWGIYHAALLLISTFLALATRRLWIVFSVGLASFLVLVFLHWNRRTERESFGIANFITLLRLGGILLLAIVPDTFPPPFITGFGVLLLIADGLDGWVAKRLTQTSDFGDRFDKETDAFFLLIICLLATFRGFIAPWILIAGIIRYVLVLMRWLVKPELGEERRSQTARVIYIIAMVGILICFLPFPSIRNPLAALAVLLLIYSFAGDFRQVFSPK